jgi:hypothetical protein
MKCTNATNFHRKSGVAQWSSLNPLTRRSNGSVALNLCHPDRSVAKWRDLQFYGPLLEMFFDRTEA